MLPEARKPTHLSPLALRCLEMLADTWNDLVASKMVALVERGAPRDFRDIHAICRAGLTTPEECWKLWRTKQLLNEQDPGATRARLSIESHLTRLARLQPIDGIADANERQRPLRCANSSPRRCSMPSWIDGSLYPDVDVPERLDSVEDKIDFIARLCGAWDFGILPEAETAAEIKKPEWRQAVEETGMSTSLAYHLLRAWHGLAELPYLGVFPAEIRNDSQLRFV